eukprot:4956642-Amphidinium_carterae.1
MPPFMPCLSLRLEPVHAVSRHNFFTPKKDPTNHTYETPRCRLSSLAWQTMLTSSKVKVFSVPDTGTVSLQMPS